MVRGSVEQVAEPEVIYAEPASAFVATFVGIANLIPGEASARIAMTRLGPVRLVGAAAPQTKGRCLVLLRPEHLDVAEAPDGPARPGTWRVARRRFAGSEILLEVVAPDGMSLWCHAGPAVRRLRPGDPVVLRLRDVETVAFQGPGGATGDSHRTDAPAEAEPLPAVEPHPTVAGS
jgi:ABC-type Fe3+/spermidine/putrescine transport system ATPase subunit